MEVFNLQQSGKSLDDLTTITSNEFASKTGYNDSIEDMKKKLEQCMQDKSEANCREILGFDEQKEELEKASAEYKTRTQLMKEKIENMDEEQIVNYLKDEGRTDDEIQEILLNNQQDLSKLAKDIAAKYEKEKNAIIDQLNQQINGRTIASKDLEDSDQAASIDAKLSTISQELSARTDEYKQLIHFNNIVSGYLELKDEQGESAGHNTASIERELADSAFDDSNTRSPASGGTFDQLQKAIEESDILSTSQDDTTTDTTEMDVDSINNNLLTH